MTESLVNITQHAVGALVEDVMKQENACQCDKCRLDAMAIALNGLAPKYVVTEQGNAYETFRMSMMQNRVDIYQAVLEAVQKVKARPRHNPMEIFKDN